MGQVNRDLLQSFLSEHIQDGDRVGWLMGLLEPFFQRAESEAYEFAPEGELDFEGVKAAIARAVGQEVAGVNFVSLESSPKPKLGEHSFASGLWRNFGDTGLGDELAFRLQTGLLDSLGDPISEVVLMDPMRKSLHTGLYYKLWGRPAFSFMASLWDSLTVSLFYFLGFAVAGKAETSERLVPLIKLLPRAIPLGVKGDEPQTWLVLTA